MTKFAKKSAEKSVIKSAIKSLRVLFIEDSVDDMLLGLNELQQAGYAVEYLRVQHAVALHDALQGSWDVILSNNNMPSFTGIDALRVIQAHALDVPFILVSDAISEVAAVNLMKAGAHDYILKDRMAQLVPVVERELKEVLIRKQHRESQTALQHSELRLRTPLDTAADAIIVINQQGSIESINHTTEMLFGYTEQQLLGQNINTLMPEPHRNGHDGYLQQFTNNGIPHIIGIGRELEAQRKDGSIFPINLSVSKMEILGKTMYTSIIRDITDRKQVDKALLRSAQQLSEAQAIGHMGNWHWDIHNDSLYWSDEIYRIFGVHPQSFKATFDIFLQQVHPDDRSLVQTAVDKALYEMQPYSIDYRICLSDGSVRFVHAQGEVRFDENGAPLRMIGTIQDITERKLSEQALRKSETRFRATFEQAAVGMAHVSLKGQWLQVNDTLCKIVGYPRTELLKITFQDITHPKDIQADLLFISELLSGKREHYSLEKRYFRKDGSITWIQLTVTLIHDSNNQPDYFISVVEDINNRKAAETRILETLNEKDTVLRELHHRVKNNMQVISSLLSLQARYANNKAPQQALQESRERIRAMALIHERLYGSTDLAKVDFLDYLRYLSERLTRLYHQTGNALKIQVSGEPLRLPVDLALPCALICNELITNAIRHAYPLSQVERLIEIRITHTGNGQPQIVVRDYGRGIEQGRLTPEPTSLGLVIIQALSRQLAGEIHFESTNGTTASLQFPLNPTNK